MDPSESQAEQDFLARHGRRSLSEDELVSLTLLDPTESLAQGRLRAIRSKISDPSDPAIALVERMQAVSTTPRASASFSNPTRRSAPTTERAAAEPRVLTAGQIEWLKALPADPQKVSLEDAEELAKLWSAVDAADRPLLRRWYVPVWRHWAQLEAKHAYDLATSDLQRLPPHPSVKGLAVQVLSKKLQEAIPELRPHEAEERAKERLTAAWRQVHDEAQRQMESARAALERASAPDLEPPEFSPARQSYERGRERARAEAAQPVSLLDHHVGD